MTKSSLTSLSRSCLVHSTWLPPLFLTPAFASSPLISLRHRTFTSSGPTHKDAPTHKKSHQSTRRTHRDPNKQRGVSAMRRTGPRVPLSISRYPLPVPVDDPPARKEFKTNPKHGLWGFFNEDKAAMAAPEDVFAHGRSWTYAELSWKEFSELHALYWVCVKERNRIATGESERERRRAGYGAYEAESKDTAVKETMVRIREVLTDRWHSWEEAMQMLRIKKLEDIDLRTEDEKGEEDGGWHDLVDDGIQAPPEEDRVLEEPGREERENPGRATVTA